jgi:hypothetical protein
VRAQLYVYRFATPEERRRTGQWWMREFERPYFPAVSLDTTLMRRILAPEE